MVSTFSATYWSIKFIGFDRYLCMCCPICADITFFLTESNAGNDAGELVMELVESLRKETFVTTSGFQNKTTW